MISFCVLAVQAAAGTGVPPQPDFSGRWTLVVALPADRDVARTLTVHQSIRRTNIQGQPMTPFYDRIAIDRVSDDGTRPNTFTIGIVGGTIGGLVANRGNAGPIAQTLRTREGVTWSGSSLVFEEGTYTGETPGSGEWTERRETWALQPNGELAITIATSGSARSARRVSATYRRSE